MKRIVPLLGLIFVLFLTAWTPAPQEGNTTDDPSTVTVGQLHIFLERSGGHLQVHEYYLISNSGDRTYVGQEDPGTGKRLTLTFPLPAGAENVTVDEETEGRFIRLTGALADTAPVPPGLATVDVSFRYELPFQNGMEVTRSFPVSVTSVVLLVIGGDLTLDGLALTPQGIMQTSQGTVLAYTAEPIPAGQTLSFQVREAPASLEVSAPATLASPAGSRNPAAEVTAGVIALVVAAVTAYVLWRPGSPGPIPPPVRPLIEAIAALDADYEAGRVSEKEYRRQREALKRQVREKMRG